MKHEKISKKKKKTKIGQNHKNPKKGIKLKKMQKKMGRNQWKTEGQWWIQISKIKLQEKGRKTSNKAKNSKRKKNETVVNLDPKESARSPNRLHMPEITKMNTSSHFRGHLKYMSIYVNQTIDEALLKPSAHQNHYLKPSKNLPQKIKLLESIISWWL